VGIIVPRTIDYLVDGVTAVKEIRMCKIRVSLLGLSNDIIFGNGLATRPATNMFFGRSQSFIGVSLYIVCPPWSAKMRSPSVIAST
jgi:hypothetical protein